MASTYSTNLKIELMATGENAGTWGNITNTNLGTAIEQALVGYGSVVYASDANLTISLTNTNAAQAARALVLNVTSSLSLTNTRELVVPTFEKQYIVQNNTTGGQSITVKTSAGTGITVPNGRKAHLYVDGTNVVQMFDFVDINGGTIDGVTIGGGTAGAGAFTTLTTSGNVTLGDATTDTVTVNGYMGVGTAPSASVALNATPTALTGTAQAGIRSWPVGNSAATSAIDAISARAQTAAASFTASRAAGLVVLDVTKGVGSTITDQHGLLIADQAQGTNNFGITSQVSSGSNKWNIYASGTANNAFAGNVRIGGVTAPTSALDVTGSMTVSGNATLGDAATDTVTVNGYMGVGGAGTTNTGLRVVSSSLLSSDQVGINCLPVFSSSATSSATSILGRVATQAASFTAAQGASFLAQDASKGAGSTITNLHGVLISDQTQGTNNFGITSQVSSGSNKWNIYASGTANNYFAGAVGVNTTSPATGTFLHVVGAIRAAASSGGLLQLEDTDVADGSTPFWTLQSDTGTFRLASANRSGTGTTGSTERMRIETSGSVGIGTTSPLSTLVVAQNRAVTLASDTNNDVIGYNLRVVDGANSRRAALYLDDATGILGLAATASSGVPDFSLTLGGLTPLYVTATGNVGIGTTSPTSTLSVAGSANVTGNVVLGDAATDTVTVNGYMGVGAAPGSSTAVLARSSALTSTTQTGFFSNITGTSAGTSNVLGFYASLDTAAASYTVNNVSGVRIDNGVKGAGSTITNQHGVLISDLTNGTNNYGILLGVTSGANKWNVYANGTANNAFAGNVRIGSTSAPTNALDVTGSMTVSGNATLGDAATDSVTVNGYMGVGGVSPSSTVGLYVRPTALTSSTQRGIAAWTEFNSAATTAVYALDAKVFTAAAAFTVSTAVGINVPNADKGAGSTITNQYGILVADQSQGTNNFGITSQVSSGTNKWNIYASGTARNHMAGALSVGATTDPGTGGLYVAGNTTLGDATTDTVTVNGYMGIGGAPNSTFALNVLNTLTSGVNQRGIRVNITGNDTSTIAGISTSVATAASAFTVGNVSGVFLNDATKGAGSTITSQYGVYISDQTQGTSNFGIASLVSSGANKWNIYASGTASNVFAGNVRIGSTSGPTNALDVTGSMTVSNNTTLGDASTDTVTVNGYMGIGGAPASANALRITSSELVGTSQIGMIVDATAASDATTSYQCLFLRPRTAAASFTVGTVLGINIADAVKGAGSTITNQFGINIADQTQGATSNIGIWVAVSSGTGKWNIYANGTASNYFAGKVGIGTTTITERLHVEGRLSAGAFSDRIVLGSSPLSLPTSDNNAYISWGASSVYGGTNGDLVLVPRTNVAASVRFYTGSGTPAERLRIDASGNVKIGGTADRATTAGTNQLVIFNGTAPVGTLTNGVSFYSASGEARVMDAAGNSTLLSPHDQTTNEWIFHSKHTPTGKVLRIDVERLLRFVNDHFGLDAVQEFIEN